MITFTLPTVLCLWFMLGIIIITINSISLIRLHSQIKSKWKELLFFFILMLLGGPIAIVIYVPALIVATLWEFLTPPIARAFRQHILNPISEWFQK